MSLTLTYILQGLIWDSLFSPFGSFFFSPRDERQIFRNAYCLVIISFFAFQRIRNCMGTRMRCCVHCRVMGTFMHVSVCEGVGGLCVLTAKKQS
jgi:hypothetical protein